MASKSKVNAALSVVDVEETLDDVAVKFERLKQLYEQYFMGIEKMEPQIARKELTRTVLVLQQQNIRNTALRFRFNMLLQKWSSYVAYWTRTMRQIENGTYVKHLSRMKRATYTQLAKAQPALTVGMSDAELHALHDRYVAARRALGDQTPVKYETLVNSLTKQVPQVLAQTGAASVAFDVATINGKVILKAVAKK